LGLALEESPKSSFALSCPKARLGRRIPSGIAVEASAEFKMKKGAK
jgi:hypothetical protein